MITIIVIYDNNNNNDISTDNPNKQVSIARILVPDLTPLLSVVPVTSFSGPEVNPRSQVAFSCHFLLVLFNLGQFLSQFCLP